MPNLIAELNAIKEFSILVKNLKFYMGIIIKNSLQVTAINYIGVIIATVSILFIQTKVLSTEEIGQIRLILDKSFLILPIIMLGMDSATTRFYFYFNENNKSKNKFISIITLIPLIAFSTLTIIIYYLNDLIQIQNLEFIIFIAFSYIYILIIEAYLTTLSKIVYPSILKSIAFRVLYILILGLLYFEYISFYQLLVSYTALHIIHLFFLIVYLKNNLDFKINLFNKFWDTPYFKEILVFSFFLFLGSSSGILASRLDTVMIENITKNESFVGIYTIALSISILIELPKRPIAQISIPILAKDLANNEIEKVSILYKKSALNLLIIASILFSLIWINIDFIFELIPNGEIYKNGKYVVFFLGLSKVIDLGLGINAEIIHNSKYYKWNLVLMPFLTIITILSNYYLISKYQSATGAAIATFIALILFNILRTILVKWKLGLLPFSKEYFFAIPFMFIPFVFDYFLLGSIQNIWIKMLLGSSFVIVFFCLPIYFLKISQDINDMINKIIIKLKS